jgi:hypothetical protein
MKSGGTSRMTRLLGHTFLKKLTLVIKFTEISLLCAKLGLTGTSNWVFFQQVTGTYFN